MTPPDDIVTALNACIQTCRDAEDGYAAAAGIAVDASLKATLLGRAKERADFVVELEALVRVLGGAPASAGTARAAAHRGWMAALHAVEGDPSVRSECARGERAALRNYEAAIDRAHVERLPSDVRRIVQNQYRTILESVRQLLCASP